MLLDFLTYLLEASVCQVVFYLFYRLALHRETFFGWNRAYLLVALLISCVIPLINVSMASPPLPIPAFFPETIQIPAVHAPMQETKADISISPVEVAWYGYLAMSGALLVRLFYQIIRLLILARQGRSQAGGAYRLVLTDGKLPTASFFNLVFWNNAQTVSEEDTQQVLRHELAHIRLRHSADLLLVEIIRVAFWFNPVIYWFKNALRDVHEYAADVAVTQQYPTNQYVQLLVKHALHESDFPVAHSFSQFSLHKRINMLQQPKSAKPRLWKLAFFLPIAAGLFLVFSCSEEVSPAERTLAAAKPSTDNILDKYRHQYPDIALKSVFFDKSAEPDQVALELIGVDNPTDTERIEAEMSQIILAGGPYSASDVIVVNPETPAKTLPQLLLEYSKQYPDININSVSINKDATGYYRVKLTVENVDKALDKARIESELEAVAPAFIDGIN